MKISVIVPVYNTERYLERCLNSIINQNFFEIEIIIINDCSSDNSLKIIKKYMNMDQRIVLINKEKNEGLSAARNSGIKIAKGEYIFHIDSDDWIEQNYFKDMYEYAIENKADIVISDYYKDFDNGELIYIQDQKGCKYKEITKKQAIENIFLSKGYPAVWNKLIKRELYTENKIKHPNGISLGEDLAVTPKLMYCAKKIVKINKAYYHYIQNEASITKSQNFNKILDIYSVLNLLTDFFKNTQIILSKEFKISQLNWLYHTKYDLSNLEYMKILNDYLYMIKKCDINKILSSKLKLVVIILKVFNNKFAFLFIWKVNKITEKLKNKF